MIPKLIKYTGLFLIIAFSSLSILFSLTSREIEDTRLRSRLSYANLLEDRFYDIRMLNTLDQSKIEKRIVLAAIDDYSIKQIGRWPFPRDNYSKLMKKLKHFGAKIIVYDVFFSEEALACPGSQVDADMAEGVKDFQSIPGNKVILGYSQSIYPHEGVYEEIPEIMYDFILDTKEVQNVGLRKFYMEKNAFPIPSLISVNPAIAHVQGTADVDGIFRHYPVVGHVDEFYFPSMGLSAYQYFTHSKPVLEMLGPENYKLKLKEGNIDLNSRGESKIRWSGGASIFPTISFWDIINASDDDTKMFEHFKGNIVFVGSTAFGAHDLRHTPIDPILPGVYLHMNVTKMFLDGKFFISENDSAYYSWLIMIIGTLAILVIQFFGNALLDLISVVVITGGIYYFETYILIPQGHNTKLFFCLFSIVSCYSWNTFLHFYMAGKDKAFLKKAFGSYISPELIDEMYKEGKNPVLGGDSGERTAFFADIQGFSSFSEKMSVTRLVKLLNQYLSAMTDILLSEKGTLDKYEGDAIIAFFGAPVPLEDHARRSCLVAHKMQKRLLELNRKWSEEEEKWPEEVSQMRMRIGINTGEIVTGNMGSILRMNYTMMGDAVNLAARLETSAKQYGVFTHVSTSTAQQAGEEFLWRELDRIKVVGRERPVETVELLGVKKEAPDYLFDLSQKFKKGLEFYRNRDFAGALSLFRQTLMLEWQRFPDFKGKVTNPSEVYIHRCEQYQQNPPPDSWDGVWILTDK